MRKSKIQTEVRNAVCFFQEQEKLHKIVLNIDSLIVSADMYGRDIDPLHEEVMRKAREMSTIAETMSKFLRFVNRELISK